MASCSQQLAAEARQETSSQLKTTRLLATRNSCCSCQETPFQDYGYRFQTGCWQLPGNLADRSDIWNIRTPRSLSPHVFQGSLSLPGPFSGFLRLGKAVVCAAAVTRRRLRPIGFRVPKAKPKGRSSPYSCFAEGQGLASGSDEIMPAWDVHCSKLLLGARRTPSDSPRAEPKLPGGSALAGESAAG